MPNSAAADVFIDGGKTNTASVVALDNNYTIGRLTLDAGDTLNFNDDTTLTVAAGGFAGSGSIIDNGTININGGYYGSTLSFTGAASLSGTGTLNLNSGSSSVYTNNSLLTVGAGFTVAGQGNVGNGSTTFSNGGTFNANQSGGTLNVLPGGAFTNTASGLLEASNGGVLQLNGNNGGAFTGGKVQALDGSTVNLVNGVTVTGATLATAGTGTVNNTNTATLANVTNNGVFNTNNSANTLLTGTLTNNGTFNVVGGYYNTTVQLTGPVTLAGTGTLNLGSGGGNTYLYAQNPGDQFSIAPTATVAGQGNLGDGQTTFSNNGTVNANFGGGTLVVQPGGGAATFANGTTGLAEATNGGTLQLAGNNGGVFSGGTFAALDGSAVTLANSPTVSGATFTTTGSGTISNTGTATLANVTNNGVFNGLNSTNTYLTGTLTNNGTFNVVGGYYNSTVQLTGPVTLAGAGTFNLTNSGQNVYVYAQNPGDRLTVGAGQTITGGGNLGAGQTTFTNRGTINANSGTLTIQPGGTATSGTDFTNAGTGFAEATAGGTLQLAGNNGGVFSGGTFQALDQSQVLLSNNPTLSGTTLVTAGSGAVNNNNSATLTNVTSNGVFNGLNGTNTYLTGTLTNNGTFNVVGGYYNTNVLLDGPVTLAGTGTLNLADGGANVAVYAQNPGDRLTVNAGATIAGAGNLGNGQTTFLNNGLVNANSSGNTLNLIPGGGSATYSNGPTGLTEATAGGILQLNGSNGGVFTAGTFQALDGSAIVLTNNPNVSGATLATAGSGTVTNVNNATLTNVTSNAAFTANNSTNTYLSGTLTNNAAFTVVGGYYGTTLQLTGPVTLNGTGTLSLANGGANLSVYAQNPGDRLTVGASQTVAGAGNLGSGQTTFTNHGLVNANSSGNTLTIQPGSGTADFTNAGAGLAEATGGGILQLAGNNGGVFTGGTFQALDTSTVNIVNGANVSAATLTTAGSGVVNAFNVTLTNVTNNGALVTPNGYSTTLAGTLTNNGSYTVNGGYYGTNVQLGGPVTLAGTGTLTLADGSNLSLYANNPGDRLTVNAGATIAGAGNLGAGQTTFLNNGTVNANASGGTLTIQPGGGAATFVNGATGLVEATGGGTANLVNSNGGTFTNNGAFAAVSGGTGGNSTLQVSAGALTNYAGATLTGGAYNVIATDASATSTISLGGGPITANAASVTLSGANTVFSEIAPLATNSGSFTVANGRNFTTVGALANTGTVVAAGGSTLTASGAFTQSSAGTLTGNGTFAAAAFTLAGNVNPGGTVSAATGAYTGGAGTTTLNGDTTFMNTQFHFELASATGPDDRLTVNGALNLNGTLNVTALAGFGTGVYDLIDHPLTSVVLSGLTLGCPARRLHLRAALPADPGGPGGGPDRRARAGCLGGRAGRRGVAAGRATPPPPGGPRRLKLCGLRLGKARRNGVTGQGSRSGVANPRPSAAGYICSAV